MHLPAITSKPVGQCAQRETSAREQRVCRTVLDRTAVQVAAVVGEALSAAGVPRVLQSAGNLFSFFFTDQPVRTYDDARTQNTAAFAAFFHAMLDHGVWLPPSAYEAWFVSAAHSDDDIERIASAARVAAVAAAAA